MKEMICKLCKRKIGVLGWPKHVNMHKRLQGRDCFKDKPILNAKIEESTQRKLNLK